MEAIRQKKLKNHLAKSNGKGISKKMIFNSLMGENFQE